MELEERLELYSKAFSRYGYDKQVIVAIEEMSELTKELTKNLRVGFDLLAYYDNIEEEIADVEIMMEQLIRMFSNRKAIDEIKNQKLERLERRLNNGEH
jgi:NTP pyrophosphatase (non-canonical NTP hydrolase)